MRWRRTWPRSAPTCRAAARNLFARSRIRAFAFEHGIKVVSVVAGKLLVEPIALTRAQLIPLKRSSARYSPEKGKLSLPLKYFKRGEGDALLAPISQFLHEEVGAAK